MLVRSDPFRELDRFTQQVLGTAARPAVMPMDAWREGDDLVVEFDLPGIEEQSLDLDVERNVVTVRAQRPRGRSQPGHAGHRTAPGGVFSRQLVLGDNLDTERIKASYRGGVLRLQIPVAEKRPNPRKITVNHGGDRQQAIDRARSSTRDRTAGDAHRRSIRAVSRHDGANGLRSPPRGRSRSGVVCGGDRAVRGGRRHPMRRGIPR